MYSLINGSLVFKYSTLISFFSDPPARPTRNSSDSLTKTATSTPIELRITLTSLTTLTKLNLSLAQLSHSLFASNASLAVLGALKSKVLRLERLKKS